MTTITTCDTCKTVVFDTRDEHRFIEHKTFRDGKITCKECYEREQFSDNREWYEKPCPHPEGECICPTDCNKCGAALDNPAHIDEHHECKYPTKLEPDEVLVRGVKILESIALGELKRCTLGFFTGQISYYREIKPHEDLKNLDDYVTIVASSIPRAKRYYEICFAKWREVSGEPITGGHKTNAIEWVGTPDNGYAVIPDDFECWCEECNVSASTELITDESHPNIKVYYSNPNDVGLNYSIEKWNDDLECETCGRKGSYYIVNDRNNIGVCIEELEAMTGDNKTFKKIEFTTQKDLDEDVHDGIMCMHCEHGELCDNQHCLFKHCDKCTEFKTPKRAWLEYHCMNPQCQNFTSSHDLSGTWCQAECFIESESGEPRPTREEYLQMTIDYGWYLDEDEIREANELGIQWRHSK